ncbi:photosynthetic complex assembly protein 2 [beta proteobacterium AAP51]|nr:photosynthetic complex assembly protein 2 [beta proteobacterium AAP51]
MSEALWPILFAVFVWWFSTGLVLLLDGLPRTTFRWSHLLSSALAVMALVGLQRTAGQGDMASAYCAFTCALLVWGWHELSFLTGWVTGPRQQPLEAGVTGWRRFVQATQTLIWHELAILATGVLIVALTWGGTNQVGTATFAVLWLMRISAKLNVFLGVRNLSLQLLPLHLRYLGSYFRQRAMNLLFPFVVTAATVVAVWLVRNALAQPAGSAAAVGGWLVATLLVLAIVEHWLLVLPLEATALWRWAMRDSSSRAAPVVEPVALSPEMALDSNDKLLHAR